MNQLVINNCSASGATSEWDFHSELENNTYGPEHNTIAEETEREYVPGTFEGPEKTLEVIFKAGEGIAGGLRNLDRAQLDELCTQARCTILSKASTAHLDAYVLSESSLFVYDYRLIMKTCGTTTLLRCLSILFEYADKLGMQLSWVGYSRKNFLFPTAQLWPHVNFGEEMRYIEQHESLQSRLRGDGHILGPVTGDHWFVYVAEGKGGSPLTTPRLSSSSASPAYGASRSELSGLDRDRAGRSSTSSLPTVLAAAEARDSRSASLSSSGTTSGGSDRGSDSPEAHDAEAECEEGRCSLDKGEDSGCCIPSVPSVLSTYTACTDDGAQMKAELTLALSQLHTHRHSTYRTFNMMMFDMAPEAAATFFQSQNGLSGKEMTRVSGICDLCPGYVIDEAAFEPCGYSMNAVCDSSYATIHITPEAQCSYVSFETNECLDDYTPLLRRVLATFRPARFVLTMFGDDDAIACLPRLPTANRAYGSIKGCPEDACYLRTSSTCTTVESQRQQCIMAVYSYQAPTRAPSPTAESPVAAL